MEKPIILHKVNWSKNGARELKLGAFTQLANVTGLPAMSVPLYWNKNGLPLGSQFIAPFGREDRLLQLAAQLEQAQPWMPQYKNIPLI